MAARPSFAKAYASATGQDVQKAEATHSAKFDRCVEHVKGKGVDNAYAVCMAQLGDEAFKSENDGGSDYEKEIDLFIRKLGISGAGPVPHSLLARQDLEGSTTKSFKGFYKSLNKAADKWWVVRYSDAVNPNMPVSQRFPTKAEAVNWMDGLTSQGIFSVLIEEEVVSTSAEKGVLETTGKQLNNVVQAAKGADTEQEKQSLAERIKNIQVKRQKATIAARKSFKDVWRSLGNGN